MTTAELPQNVAPWISNPPTEDYFDYDIGGGQWTYSRRSTSGQHAEVYQVSEDHKEIRHLGMTRDGQYRWRHSLKLDEHVYVEFTDVQADLNSAAEAALAYVPATLLFGELTWYRHTESICGKPGWLAYTGSECLLLEERDDEQKGFHFIWRRRLPLLAGLEQAGIRLFGASELTAAAPTFEAAATACIEAVRTLETTLASLLLQVRALQVGVSDPIDAAYQHGLRVGTEQALERMRQFVEVGAVATDNNSEGVA